MDEVALMSAKLIREGVIRRKEVPSLQHPEIRAALEQRLASVGLRLVSSAYSEHLALAIHPDAAAEPGFDAASNLGLRSDALALIAVLWSKLVLQKRTAIDEGAPPPGQVALFATDRRAEARRHEPAVHLETLVAEFGSAFGGRTRVQQLLGQLKRLRFVSYATLDRIEAGPMLELGIDGERMVAFIRSRVLGKLLEDRQSAAAAEPKAAEVPEERVRAALSAAKDQTLAMRELAVALPLPEATLRSALRRLQEAGEVEKLGERKDTRYRLVARSSQVAGNKPEAPQAIDEANGAADNMESGGAGSR